jgi:hypothetical protein
MTVSTSGLPSPGAVRVTLSVLNDIRGRLSVQYTVEAQGSSEKLTTRDCLDLALRGGVPAHVLAPFQTRYWRVLSRGWFRGHLLPNPLQLEDSRRAVEGLVVHLSAPCRQPKAPPRRPEFSPSSRVSIPGAVPSATS